MIIVEGDHNSNRPRFLFDSAAIFLVHILQVCTYNMKICMPKISRYFFYSRSLVSFSLSYISYFLSISISHTLSHSLTHSLSQSLSISLSLSLFLTLFLFLLPLYTLSFSFLLCPRFSLRFLRHGCRITHPPRRLGCLGLPRPLLLLRLLRRDLVRSRRAQVEWKGKMAAAAAAVVTLTLTLTRIIAATSTTVAVVCDQNLLNMRYNI